MTATKWPEVALGDVADLQAGAGFPVRLQGKADGDYPFAKVGDISRSSRAGSRFLLRPANFLDESELSLVSARPLPKGTVVFAKIGEAIRQNHRVVLSSPTLIDNNAMGAIPRADRLDGGYLYRFLQTIDLYPLASSTTVPSIRKSVLAQVQMPLPPVTEQRRIAAVMDQADGLRAKRREVLARFDSLTESIFLDMFGSLLDSQETVPLDELITDGRPICYGILKPGPDLADGTPYVRVVDMKNGGIDAGSVRRTSAAISHQYRRSLLRAGDLIMSIRGHVGRLASVPPDLDGANITQDSARISVAGAHPSFVLAHLRCGRTQQWMERHTRGVAVRGINIGDIRRIPIAVPTRERQETFARRADAVAGQRVHASRSAERLDELFASLQQRAFRGDL